MLISGKNLTRPRVCAVSYLNTVPLVWGLQHDARLGEVFELEFALPSVCAARLEDGSADLGIVPVAEIGRQGLAYFEETGIACEGPVRSILLISKVPFSKIKKLAVDAGSRTSVRLAQIILAERYGAEPILVRRPADLSSMLNESDAALIIGDPALLLDPASLPFDCLDLGQEWLALTGLPMVFALWAGRPELIEQHNSDLWRAAFRQSCQFGLDHVGDMVEAEAVPRGFSRPLATRYFTEHIQYQLTPRHLSGMQEYLRFVTLLDKKFAPTGVS